MDRAQRLTVVGIALLVSGCTMVGATEFRPRTPSAPEPAGPAGPFATEAARRAEPPSRRGNMVQYRQSGATYHVLDSSHGYDQRGIASWYGRDFHGRPTSSGEPYDMYELSAAHRTLPLPSYVEVTNLANGRSLVVRVNDRGPFHDPDRRIIDLSFAAAERLGITATGTAPVRVRAVEPWQTRTR